MLKGLRIILAVLSFAGLTLLFLDVSGVLPPKLAVLAKMQFIPALLSGSLAVIIALVGLTLLLGRVYCSVLCPLGVLQDVVSRFGRKRRFRFSPAKTWLRAGTLLVFAAAFFAGVPVLFSILEPYSAFGRIATDLMAPVWQAGSNLLALASQRAGNFAVGPTPVWQKGLPALAAAVLTLGGIGLLAWKSGRTWCNTLCPVGTVLGYCSRVSLFRPRIDAKECAHCGLCAKACKASCIDAKSAVIDASRCVTCFNCLDTCRRGALTYAPAWKDPATKGNKSVGPDLARRSFFALGLSVVSFPTLALARNPEVKAPDLTRKNRPAREVPITPPGASGLRSFTERCTGCQLCVSACPNQVLSNADEGTGVLQPSLSFERGFCRVNCVTCSTVCPTGAIRPISAAEKSATQIGRAVVDWERCIVNTDKVQCTACSKACPTNAACLVGRKDGPKWLAVDPERCTGCGACEYVCPVRPLAAIRVEGNLLHRRI